jgi:GNAT superfamily N-acetyltransferase
MNQQIEISNDKSRLDIALIHEFLSKESYWAKGRSVDIVKKSIENSLCFGIYLDDRQIGFARVVTDYAVIAWLMDVFILKEYRGKGYGQELMNNIINHSLLKDVRKMRLGTEDAHSFYRKSGFQVFEKPGNMMELNKN